MSKSENVKTKKSFNDYWNSYSTVAILILM